MTMNKRLPAYLGLIAFGIGLATAGPGFAQDGTILGAQFLHPNYTPVARAGNADHATAADAAANAAHANQADAATMATNAQSAVTAGTADWAALAQQANQATQASTALQANIANIANTATNATHAGTADSATTAQTSAFTDYAYASQATSLYPTAELANAAARQTAWAMNVTLAGTDFGPNLQGSACGEAYPCVLSTLAQLSNLDPTTGSTCVSNGDGPCYSTSASNVRYELSNQLPATPVVINGVTFYAQHFSPIYVPTTTPTDNSGGGGGDGSGPGGGDGSGSGGGGSGAGGGDN